MWRVLRNGAVSAREQMALDERLASEVVPTVRIFAWARPALSLGLKQPVPAWVTRLERARGPVEVVERPTGGGLAFHGSDVSVAVVVPRDAASVHDVLAHVGQGVARLCASFGVDASHLGEGVPGETAARIVYCLTQTSRYAVVAGGRKVAGLAVRRFPESWLVHGSLWVQPLPAELVGVVPPEVLGELHRVAHPLAALARMPLTVEDAAARWAAAWTDWWDDVFTRTIEPVNH